MFHSPYTWTNKLKIFSWSNCIAICNGVYPWKIGITGIKRAQQRFSIRFFFFLFFSIGGGIHVTRIESLNKQLRGKKNVPFRNRWLIAFSLWDEGKSEDVGGRRKGEERKMEKPTVKGIQWGINDILLWISLGSVRIPQQYYLPRFSRARDWNDSRG